jgi:hypothetical protein
MAEFDKTKPVKAQTHQGSAVSGETTGASTQGLFFEAGVDRCIVATDKA